MHRMKDNLIGISTYDVLGQHQRLKDALILFQQEGPSRSINNYLWKYGTAHFKEWAHQNILYMSNKSDVTDSGVGTLNLNLF